MQKNGFIRFILWLILLALLLTACAQNEVILKGNAPCGDGECAGPENPKNCPQDCREDDGEPILEGGSMVEIPPLYLGIMVHLEGWRAELNQEDMFDHHAGLIREYAALFETYGAKLTWESKETTDASIIWGDNVLKEMEDRGHGVGVHADLAGQLDYDCGKFERELFVRKETLESLGVTVRHASGVVSHCDWVTAMADAGYGFTSGMVAYGVMSLPEEIRPAEFRYYQSPSACHDTFPEALEDRVHPWRMNSGSDWIDHDPQGVLVMLPASHGLACFEENAKGTGCDQDFTQEDIDLFFEELDRAITLRDPGQVNMYYVGWSLGKPLDMDLMEEWLQRVQSYVEAGTVEWKTLGEMYDAYVQ